MKKLINLIVILLILIFFSNQLFAIERRKRHTIEQTTEILLSKKVGNLKLDHDDHIYKFIKISKSANDLEGAINVLIASNTKLGDTLDNEEVKLIIKISQLDTNLYQDIMIAMKKIGKKRTTIAEHYTIIDKMKKKKGKYLLTGIGRAVQCNYTIENDYLSLKRLNLLVKIGKLKSDEKMINIYAAMRRVGMGSDVNSKGIEVIYKLSNLKGDVAYKIDLFLKNEKWRSRKEPGEREYSVVKYLMKDIYVAHEGSSDYDKIKMYLDKPGKKHNKKYYSKKKYNKKYYSKKKHNKKYYANTNKKSDKINNNSTEYGSYKPCAAFISQN